MNQLWYEPILPSILANLRQSPPYIAGFDSATFRGKSRSSVASYARSKSRPLDK
jgi:hypothetical protein